MTDRPSVSIIRAEEVRSTDGDTCPFCGQPLGNLPTDDHPYVGVRLDLDANLPKDQSDASCLYECQGERKTP